MLDKIVKYVFNVKDFTILLTLANKDKTYFIDPSIYTVNAYHK